MHTKPMALMTSGDVAVRMAEIDADIADTRRRCAEEVDRLTRLRAAWADEYRYLTTAEAARQTNNRDGK